MLKLQKSYHDVVYIALIRSNASQISPIEIDFLDYIIPGVAKLFFTI